MVERVILTHKMGVRFSHPEQNKILRVSILAITDSSEESELGPIPRSATYN